MGKRINLIGQKFGRLTVLEHGERTKDKRIRWICLCDCGTFTNVLSHSLQSGNTQSCGCYQKDRASEANYKDLTNQKFGRLTVLEEVGRNKHQRVIWRCLCECGNIVNVIGNNLQNSHTQSCGCYNKERLSEIHLGENHHNWKGGISPLNEAVRNCTRYREWRTSVFQRDNFTCTHCNDFTGGNLIAHHTVRFSVLMGENHITTLEEAIQNEALWVVSNGITLCLKCHKKLHKKKPLTL